MFNDGPMMGPPLRVALVDATDAGRDPDVRTRATRDRSLIQQWAVEHGAEPATGEASASGPATPLAVNDGDAGLRFNFPGHARYRPVSWDEWFDHFDRHELTFVFEGETSGQPLGYRWRLMPSSELRRTASVV
jgi:hypothetical protein